MPNLDIDHLSYSSISTYLRCPRAWRYHYLDKIPAPVSPALAFGSAFHRTVEEHLVWRSQPDYALSLTERWTDCWQRQIEQEEGEIAWGGDTPEALSNDGIRILSDSDVVGVIDSIVPLQRDTEPLTFHIEDFVKLHMPGVPIPVVGFIDVITEDGIPCDLKTSSRSWSADRAQSEMQPVFYLAALNQAGYELNPDLRFRHYVFVKTKTPRVQIWETQRTPADLFWLFGLIAEVWRGIEAEVFPPNPMAWKCSEKYCEYWAMCRGGG